MYYSSSTYSNFSNLSLEAPRAERLNSTGQSGSGHGLTRSVRARLDDNILIAEQSSSANYAVGGGEVSTDELDMDVLFHADTSHDDGADDKDTST